VETLSIRKFRTNSPTSGSRSVGIVLSRTQATEFCVFVETLLTIDQLWFHLAIYLMGTGEGFLGGKAEGAWSWQLSPTSVQIRETWIYTSTPPYAFMA
jgi:hypothetical protein